MLIKQVIYITFMSVKQEIILPLCLRSHDFSSNPDFVTDVEHQTRCKPYVDLANYLKSTPGSRHFTTVDVFNSTES